MKLPSVFGLLFLLIPWTRLSAKYDEEGRPLRLARFYSASPLAPLRHPAAEKQAVQRTQIKLIVIAIIAVVAVFAVLGAVGVFSPPETLSITQISFNFSCAADQVLFSLTNTGQADVTISQVVAAQTGVPGQLVSTQLTSGALPKGASTILIAFFPGAIFVGGAAYTFTLDTTRGGSFPTSATVPTFAVTEQLAVNQINFNGGSGITFSLSNPGACDLSIASATVRGSGISGTVTGSILSGNYVTAGSSSQLAVNFSGITFQSGQRYTFTLTSSRGTRWVASANAP